MGTGRVHALLPSSTSPRRRYCSLSSWSASPFSPASSLSCQNYPCMPPFRFNWGLNAGAPRSRTSSANYDLLPTSSDASSAPSATSQVLAKSFRPFRICQVLVSRRRARTLLLVLALIGTALVAAATYVINYPLPPLYRRFHEAELALPQHNPELPAPEGRSGRYLWVANHASSESQFPSPACASLRRYARYRWNRVWMGQRDARDVLECISRI